jgi:hypothetical protein
VYIYLFYIKDIRGYLQNIQFNAEEPHKKVFAEFLNREVGKKEFLSMSSDRFQSLFKFNPETVDLLVEAQRVYLEVDLQRYLQSE